MAEGKTCPNCGNSVPELLRIDPDMRQRLSSEAGVDTTAESVCPNCYSSFGNQIAKGSAKRSQRQAKEQHRLALWRSRVQLIREARERFMSKDYSGAAMAYEKYIRVLEIIYEVKVNELTPTHFNNSARIKELVVISSAYWDLLRIYDQSPRFKKRLDQCAAKLADFLQVTPAKEDILKKIEEYWRGPAKNKAVFQNVYYNGKKGKRRCFIATAAFETAASPEVKALTIFRDQTLMSSALGRLFVESYYLVSPMIAGWLDRHEGFKPTVRWFLRQLSQRIQKNLKIDRL